MLTAHRVMWCFQRWPLASPSSPRVTVPPPRLVLHMIVGVPSGRWRPPARGRWRPRLLAALLLLLLLRLVEPRVKPALVPRHQHACERRVVANGLR